MLFLQQYGPRLFCLLLLAVAAWVDVKTRRIPNALTMPILSFCFISATMEAVNSLQFVKLLFLIVCFFIGMLPGLGLGDIKLIMCVGAITSPFWVMIETAIASILVLVVLAIRNPASAFVKLQRGIQNPFPVHQNIPKKADNSVPFALYLFAAYILVEGGKIIWAFLQN